MEANPEFVMVKCDIQNAFNSISRAKVLKVLEEEDSLRHLVHHTALSLAPEGTLETGGKVWGKAANGTTQGDPEAGGHFCVGWQPEVVEVDTILSAVGGAARAGCDGLTACGPP